VEFTPEGTFLSHVGTNETQASIKFAQNILKDYWNTNGNVEVFCSAMCPEYSVLIEIIPKLTWIIYCAIKPYHSSGG
jgi:hypothetical protein